MTSIADRCESAAKADRRLDAQIWAAWQGVKLLEFDCSRSNTEVLSYDGVRAHPDWPSVGHYTSSIDDAVLLVPSGYAWTVATHGVGPFKYWASVCLPDEDAGSTTGLAATPALALCAAALRSPQGSEEAK